MVARNWTPIFVVTGYVPWYDDHTYWIFLIGKFMTEVFVKDQCNKQPPSHGIFIEFYQKDACNTKIRCKIFKHFHLNPPNPSGIFMAPDRFHLWTKKDVYWQFNPYYKINSNLLAFIIMFLEEGTLTLLQDRSQWNQ